MDNDEVKDSILNHKARNELAWKTLAAKGYSEGTPVKISFFFSAADEKKAEELSAFLAQEARFSARAVFEDGGWGVAGATQEAVISLDLLNAWVEWMVRAGHQFNAYFDGWDAEIKGVTPI